MKRAYDRSMKDQKIQKKIGYPYTRTYLKVAEEKFLPNCPIARETY